MKEVGDFKSYTARRILDHLETARAFTLLRQFHNLKLPHKTDRQFQLWQEGSQPKSIQDDDMMRQKLEYLHNNPVKRGYVDDPTHYRLSSARNYAGRSGLIEVRTAW